MQSNQYDQEGLEPTGNSPLERNQRRKSFWTQVFQEDKDLRQIDDLALELLHPLRIRVAFRIVREIARVKQVCYDDEPLSVLLEQTGFDGWVEDIDPPQNRTGMTRDQKWVANAKIPLLPPPDDEDHRHMIPTYFQAFNKIYRYLGLSTMIELRKGYLGLTEGACYRKLWPTLEEILSYENALLHELLSLITEHGSLRGRDEAKKKHGFRRWEEDSFFAIAKSGAVELMSGSAEESRAVMLMRLENFIQRCKDEGDLRAELACFKLVSDLQNLRSAKTEDLGSQLVDVVEDRSKELKEKQKNDWKKLENDSGSSGGRSSGAGSA